MKIYFAMKHNGKVKLKIDFVSRMKTDKIQPKLYKKVCKITENNSETSVTVHITLVKSDEETFKAIKLLQRKEQNKQNVPGEFYGDCIPSMLYSMW
jgi:hypothetical protein